MYLFQTEKTGLLLLLSQTKAENKQNKVIIKQILQITLSYPETFVNIVEKGENSQSSLSYKFHHLSHFTVASKCFLFEQNLNFVI